MSLYNVVDRMYIGHIPDIGALALTGVGVCMPIIMLISAFAALVSMGSAPRASVLMGRGNNEEAHYTLGNSFIMLIIIALILTVFFRRFAEPILMAFGASENTIGYAMDYMRIYTLGTIFVQFALGLNAFITAQGFAKISMVTVVIGAIINVVLDPIFIFGFHMGVKGAALATIISQAVSAIWVLRFLTGENTAEIAEKIFPPPWLRSGTLSAAGDVPIHHAGNGKRHQRLLQLLSVSLWQRHCRRCYEYFDQHHAVFHAALCFYPVGHSPLQGGALGVGQRGPCASDFPPAAAVLFDLFSDTVGNLYGIPSSDSVYVYGG